MTVITESAVTTEATEITAITGTAVSTAIKEIRTGTMAVDETRDIMMGPRNSQHRTKTHQEYSFDDAAGTKGGAWVVAGRTAYREEFQLDYGPDLDEALDGAESGREF